MSTTATGNKCRSLEEIIHFNEKHAEKCLVYGQGILIDAQKLSGTLTEPEYLLQRFKTLRQTGPEGISKIIETHQLDAIISPGISDASPISGYPSITVPLGYESDNMPFGLTIIGLPYSEPQLIEIGYAFEQITKARKLPPIEFTE